MKSRVRAIVRQLSETTQRLGFAVDLRLADAK